jgi:L-threonylcarbamoyladenylate synthase
VTTLVLRVDPKRPDPAVIAYAAAGIRYGRLVAFPTETVYGLAAHRSDRRAIAALYAVKERPRGKPLTVHIADTAAIAKMGCVLTAEARALIRRYWPGPLTIILKARNGSKIGFRMPANRIAYELIRLAGVPVVAPSANLSGRKAPTDARGVLRGLKGRIDLVIDGGRTKVGVESTVIDLAVSPPRVLREGAIGTRQIEKILARLRSAHGAR